MKRPLGPVPRPAGTPTARPHLPHRPLWLCRTCAAPWPCGTARLALLAEFQADPVGLSVYLCSALYEAAADLYRLNPHDGPDPRDLFERFVGWPTRRADHHVDPGL